MKKLRSILVISFLLLALFSPLSAQAQSGGGKNDSDIMDEANRIIECKDFDGEQYCLLIGFIEAKKGSAEWNEYLFQALSTPDSPNGESSLKVEIDRRAALPKDLLVQLETQEFDMAKQAVGRVKLARLMAKQQEIPAGFFKKYSLFDIAEESAQAKELRRASIAGEAVDLRIFNPSYTTDSTPVDVSLIGSFYRRQLDANWCSAATLESFIDSDHNSSTSSKAEQQSLMNSMGWVPGQPYPGITAIATQINNNTNWDSSAHGGTYVETVISASGIGTLKSYHQIRIGLGQAPIVERVKLDQVWLPYINTSCNIHLGSHYQTGRGYYFGYNNNNNDYVRIFEPYTGYCGYLTQGQQILTVQQLFDAIMHDSAHSIGW